MAVHKATRSHSLAQPTRRHPNPHLKSELFDDLRQLNRGYGVALAALSRLEKPGLFPRDCLRSFVHRTEALRALVNRDLLRHFAGREDLDAERFNHLCAQPAAPPPYPRPNRRSNP
jgi:hypothetical protein